MFLKIKIAYTEMSRPTNLKQKHLPITIISVYAGIGYTSPTSFLFPEVTCMSFRNDILLVETCSTLSHYHTRIPSKVSLNNELMCYQHLPHLQMLSHKTVTVSEKNVHKAHGKFLKRHFRTNNTLMLLAFTNIGKCSN